MDSLLPLGTAPRPATGDDLAARLRDTLRDAGRGQVHGLDEARIEANLDGADVHSLELDLTGVAVGVPAQGSAAEAPSWEPDIVSRDEAVLRTLRLEAHPLTAVDLPVDLAAELQGVRFAWVAGADGSVGAEIVEPSEDSPVTGSARLAVSREGLAGTVRGLLTVALAGNGIQLTDFDMQIDQTGPRDAAIAIEASIKKGMFLSAKITATASAAVDAHMVLTVGDVQLSSGNPIVGALLGAVKGRVEAVAGQRIDLAEALPPGVRLTDVRLDVGDEIVVSAQLG
ncbi:hypothetical protein BCE75_107200 [Isoptericola sp. CG 20/1183]|uniref:DUF2993 domain-containing protein n=1 Tax=Isoptericola halotolerans TaxID=300560 RepID=A0ABX5EFP6_9MICO|nr:MULTISPECIES: hypothetical protein [Isoptericola]PRZ05712.1 hypothetical protein BCL65_107200 [Isoptericola halotolerans]PRZ06280.1 hypothetical protein BCE75_107200 [Isoptericola sp. CG 20/1183]